MEPPTHKPLDAGSPATYGALLTNAGNAAVHALSADPDPSFNIGDFARFLSSAGLHLDLLLRIPPGASTSAYLPMSLLAAELTADPGWRSADQSWARAADQLGAAHDLLSTHVGPDGGNRTSQARLLAPPAAIRAAMGLVVDIIAEPIQASHDERLIDHLDAVRTVDRASSSRDALGRLGLLTSIRTTLGRDPEHTTIASPPEAFSLLHQLASSQAQARSSANAHTLRDLCVLGSVTCLAAGRLLPPGESPLGRLDRAATLDHLDHASSTWRGLGGRLYPGVQGLLKAPGAYHRAIEALIDECRTSGSMNWSVLASLPGLAVQAATTVTVLSSRHALVTCGTTPVRSGPQWLPLDATETARLAEDFLAAGRATYRAKTALTRQLRASNRDIASTSNPVARTRSRSVRAHP